jgi:ribosomal protein S18 acetylase RimI-like enzyme
MPTAKHVKIRFAVENDLTWAMKHDHDAKLANRMRYKIALNEIILAEFRSRIVGYLRLEYLWMKIPYVGLIHVSPGYRRKGIGRAMLSFLEQRLRREGHNILLSSSQVNEPFPSQAWHRAVGFDECGIINGINKGGIGEVFFRKKLQRNS